MPLVRSNMLPKDPKSHIVFLTYIWSQKFTSGGSRTQTKTPVTALPVSLLKGLKKYSECLQREPLSCWNQQCGVFGRLPNGSFPSLSAVVRICSFKSNCSSTRPCLFSPSSSGKGKKFQYA